MSVSTAVSIAGSDPSGGAGIQADLKAFSARGVYGMSVITALTAQNTQGVSGVHVVPADFVHQQIRAIFDDIRVDAIKVGMIANADIAEAVGDALKGFSGPIVLDPVMVAKGGHPLLPQDAVSALSAKLLPLATVLTPNLPEAAALLGRTSATSRNEMLAQGRALLEHGPQAVFMKGGHLEADDSPDLLISDDTEFWLNGPRFDTQNTHGTGCSISSAIAAELAKGQALATAVKTARHWLEGAIQGADSLDIGRGHGPTHHFHALWPVA